MLDPLSLELLEGNFRDGDTVVADVENGRIVFRKKAAQAAANEAVGAKA